jgi:hypothetical protein
VVHLLIAADEPAIEKAASTLRDGETEVRPLQADLETTDGVDRLYAATQFVRWMPYWRILGAASAVHSWTRNLERRGGSSIQTSQAQST